MKKLLLLLLLLLLLILNVGYSQNKLDSESSVTIKSSEDIISRLYLGTSLGATMFAEGFSNDLAPTNEFIDRNTGLSLSLNLGYRFSEKWGATINLYTSGTGTDKTGYGKDHIGIGPTYTINISDKIVWDIKPQIALNLTTYPITEPNTATDTFNGSKFVSGNSLVFGHFGKGLNFTINIDYLYTSSNQLEYINNFDLGLGLRYNFWKRHKRTQLKQLLKCG